ncbi:MAG TPA: putative peptidoglycan glycosyltransferase FtsW [Phycisphaerales bacterium]|nr:putative peptidoglycan glycosyltransferase FtsW [Phycisphaerales bacterium]
MRAGQVIALAVIGLLTIGVMMVNSATMHVEAMGDPAAGAVTTSASSIMFSRATVYMALAVGAMAFAAFVPVRRLAGYAEAWAPRAFTIVLAASVGLVAFCALAYVPALERKINGSHRWIQITETLSMQPSEVAKWAMVLLIALYGASRVRVIHEFWRGLVPALFCVGLVAGFIVLEDLGTGVLIGVVACLMLLAAGARLRYFMMAVPVALIGIAGAIITSPYRVKRILAFIDPYEDPKGIGYHTIQSLLAIANGGGFGRGLGHGLQKFNYLPEDHTDFIFAIICEELGIAGAALVTALFATLVWTGFMVMRREQNPLLRLVVLGVIATVGVQAVINLMVVTGMAPTKGIALPLLSYGGTGWILTAASLGLVISIDRTQHEGVEAGLEEVPISAESPIIEAAPLPVARMTPSEPEVAVPAA